MKILVKRTFNCPNYCIGHLYIDGKYFSDTLEDTDRGLDSSMTVEEIKKRKKYGVTAIPTGTYKVDMNTVSPLYAKKNRNYSRPYGHKMPRLVNVKCYSGVLIHPGTTANQTFGCLLVGENKIKGKLINSQATWKRLMDTLLKDKDNITITYERTYNVD